MQLNPNEADDKRSYKSNIRKRTSKYLCDDDDNWKTQNNPSYFIEFAIIDIQAMAKHNKYNIY